MLTSIRNVKFYKNALEYNVYHRCLCYFLNKMLIPQGVMRCQHSSTLYTSRTFGRLEYIHVIHRPWSVRIGKNCARGLEVNTRQHFTPPVHLDAWNTYMLFTGLGRSVLGKTVPEVSSTARGRRPRAVLETESCFYFTHCLINVPTNIQ